MKEHNLSQSVLKKIEKKHIKPKPKWEFLLKDVSVWILSLSSLLIGSLATAVMMYMIRNNDWEVYESMSDSLFMFILFTLPYFWIILLALFVLVAQYNFKHTKRGYRFRVPAVVGLTVVFTVLLGGLLYNAGVGQAIDDKVAETVPYYEHVINPRMKAWTKPKEGFLFGMIESRPSEKVFLLRDKDGRAWEVQTNGTFIPPMMPLGPGQMIKMFGEMREDDIFHAEKLIPPGPGRGMFKRRGFNEMMRKMQESGEDIDFEQMRETRELKRREIRNAPVEE